MRARLSALGFLGFSPDTRAYFGSVAKQVLRELFSPTRRDFLLSVLVAGAALLVSFLVSGEIDVTALVTFLTLVGLVLFFGVRGFLTVAATRDSGHETQTRSHRETIESLTERIEMARWARAVRQQILGDLVDDLRERRTASDVREALISAGKRCETTFSHLPGDLARVPEPLYELADGFQRYDEEEKDGIIGAVKTLQTSSMADPDI